MANPIQLNHVSGMQMSSKSTDQNISLHCLPQDTESLILSGVEGTMRMKGDVLGKKNTG